MAVPSKTAVLQYSVLALPLAFAGLPLYIHAPDFYTRELGLGIGVIGITLLLIRLFDAVQDPIIGYLSDRYAGRRFSLITVGALLLWLGMAAVFYGPPLAMPITLWFVLAMVLATTGFSMVTINLTMIGGFWRDEPAQRTRISAWREGFALVGLLIASILPAALQSFQPAAEAFKILVWVFSVSLVVAFVLFHRFMGGMAPDHTVTRPTTATGLSFLPILLGPDRQFFMVCFLSHLAAAMPGVLVLLFIHDYLQADHWSGLFLFLYFISGAAFMIVWVKLAGKIGKARTWLGAMLLAVVTFIGAFFLQPGDIIAYSIICILSGMALGADLALPPAMLADRVTRQKKQAQATQYYALIAFIPKIALAMASGVALLSLGYLGFVAGMQNSPQTKQGLITLYALVPCFIKLIAAYTLWRLYKLEGDIDVTIEKTGSHGIVDIS